MTQNYDVLTIGLGPAGMAVSVMASEMGLKVCAVEREHIGGECMNVGCIPSKALLRMGRKNALLTELGRSEAMSSAFADPFGKIASSLEYISKSKTMGMFKKVDLIFRQGEAHFTGPGEVEVGGRKIRARRIFICAGTRPAIPDIQGLRELRPLTNETLFQLKEIPASLLVLGSGAIACEMAQAFARMGSTVSMVFRGKGLLWREDPEAGALLEQRFEQEGIILERNASMLSFEPGSLGVKLTLKDGRVIEAEKVLCALGRSFDPQALGLDKAGIATTIREL